MQIKPKIWSKQRSSGLQRYIFVFVSQYKKVMRVYSGRITTRPCVGICRLWWLKMFLMGENTILHVQVFDESLWFATQWDNELPYHKGNLISINTPRICIMMNYYLQNRRCFDCNQNDAWLLQHDRLQIA